MNDIYFYVKECEELFCVSEGTGDNLLPEDVENGFKDYLNYTVYRLDGGIEEYDGGMLLLKELISDMFEGKTPEEIAHICIPWIINAYYGVSCEYTLLKA